MWKQLLGLIALACAFASPALADAYPSKPIRILLGFSGGGADDILARLIAPRLAERLGQPVVVESRPGASGTIAALATAKAPADGHHLMLGSSASLSTTVSLYRNLGYNLLNDFSFVTTVASSGQILAAHPSLPARSIEQLVAYARTSGKPVPYGSTGVASSAHLAMELLQGLTGVQFLHVPYKGSSQLVAALVGGEVMMGFSSAGAVKPMLESGRLNALGVSSLKRLGNATAGLRTIAEQGYPAYDVTFTLGILAPAGTPPEIVKRLNTEIGEILKAEDIRKRIADQGMEAGASTPEAYKALMRSNIEQWAKVIKDANISIE
jgi:tripartite-type tricarboxylate transporter receptor subunit TctC